MTALRDLELDVLTDFAAGRNLTDIAKDRGVHLDRVTGILTRRCGMDRAKAKEIVEQVGTSPLTAPIQAKSAKTKAAAPAPPARPAVVLAETPAVSSTMASKTTTDPWPGLVEPRYPDPLDVGIEAVSEKLRDLVWGLARNIARAHRANDLRTRVVELEAALKEAQDELELCEKAGNS